MKTLHDNEQMINQDNFPKMVQEKLYLDLVELCKIKDNIIRDLEREVECINEKQRKIIKEKGREICDYREVLGMVLSFKNWRIYNKYTSKDFYNTSVYKEVVKILQR